MVVDEQDGACGEGGGGDRGGQGEGDVVGGELDVGRPDQDVVDVLVCRGPVEVEGGPGARVLRVAVAAPEGAVFDDAGEGDGDAGGYFGSGSVLGGCGGGRGVWRGLTSLDRRS